MGNEAIARRVGETGSNKSDWHEESPGNDSSIFSQLIGKPLDEEEKGKRLESCWFSCKQSRL